MDYNQTVNVNSTAVNAGGVISKMHASSSMDDHVVKYYLILDNKPIALLNNNIDKKISLQFSGVIKCIYCYKKTNKSYNQGYCYLCAIKLARCDLCIISPQKCHYHLGTCREPAWGQQHCFIPHIVYLANSSGIKVGISRKNNLLNRWIDQGAIQGLPIITTKSRYQSGLVEIVLAKIISDKTNWRKMLSFGVDPIDLISVRNQLLNTCCKELQEIKDQFPAGDLEILQDLTIKDVINIQYPVSDYLKNIKLFSLNNLIKSHGNFTIEDQLLAIKGQYLIFPSGVLNVRSLTGYEVNSTLS